MNQIDRNFDDKLFISDGIINYEPAVNEGWRLPVKQLRIFGELTTNEGPATGDYYLIFVVGENEWRVATAYVRNQEDFLKELGKLLGCTITLNLFSSTDWRSNTIWPDQLKGKQLMEFKELPPKNFWERVKQRLGLGSPTTLILTDEIKQFIKEV